MTGWRTLVVPDAAAAGRAAAHLVAAGLREAVAQRGAAVLALSGGSSPLPMLDRLVGADVPWSDVTVVQVDERVVPEDSPDRNLRMLRERLLDHVPATVVPLEVDHAGGPDAGAAASAAALRRVLDGRGGPDVVHLGVGGDGHTASLFPGDPALDATGPVVAVGEHAGHRRITLTGPVIDAAGSVVALAPGADKAAVLRRVLDGDRALPAARVSTPDRVLVTDAVPG